MGKRKVPYEIKYPNILTSGNFLRYTFQVLGEKINIEIREKVTLPEKQMVLGDIAYVSCNNPSLWKGLIISPLETRPGLATSGKLKRTSLMHALWMKVSILKGSLTAVQLHH